MKKMILALTAILMMSGVAMAQDDNGQPQGSQQGKAPSKEEIAERQTQQMVKQLNLTDAQKVKVQALNEKYADKMGPMMGGGGPRPGGGRPGGPGMGRDNSGEQKADGQTEASAQKRPELTDEQKAQMESKRKEFETNRQAYEKELKEILSDDQYKSFQSEQQKRRPGGGQRPPQRQENSGE